MIPVLIAMAVIAAILGGLYGWMRWTIRAELAMLRDLAIDPAPPGTFDLRRSAFYDWQERGDL